MQKIRSSEVSKYLFCPVSWWIEKNKGVKINSAMVEGEKHYALVSENVPKAKFLYYFIVIVGVILAALVTYRFLG